MLVLITLGVGWIDGFVVFGVCLTGCRRTLISRRLGPLAPGCDAGGLVSGAINRRWIFFAAACPVRMPVPRSGAGCLSRVKPN